MSMSQTLLKDLRGASASAMKYGCEFLWTCPIPTDTAEISWHKLYDSKTREEILKTLSYSLPEISSKW